MQQNWPSGMEKDRSLTMGVSVPGGCQLTDSNLTVLGWERYSCHGESPVLASLRRARGSR